MLLPNNFGSIFLGISENFTIFKSLFFLIVEKGEVDVLLGVGIVL